MALVSVIVPCYNAEKYIIKCLDALSGQSFDDFDVILIDDCSTDSTYEVIQSYRDSHKLNIIYLKNEVNSGPAHSRNFGVEVSDSEYIAFCDSDDWYEPDYLSSMIDAAKAADADIVLCNSRKVSEDGKIIASDTSCALSQPISVRDMLVLGVDSFCRMLVRRSIVIATPAPNIRNGEDMAVIPLMITKAKRFSIVDKPLYNYLCRPGSLSMNATEKTVLSLEKSYEHIICNCTVIEEYTDEIELIGIKNLVYGALLNHFKFSKDKARARDILCRFESNYPLWHKNKYIKTLPLYKRVFVRLAKKRCFGLIRCMCHVHKSITERSGES